MSSIGTGYDLSTSVFSPDGRLFQVDYAQKAVEASGTAVAIRGKDGIVFAVEKIITSKLYEKESNRRIFSVDRHVGMAGSGLYADVRQLADIAMTECANYKSDYGSPIPIKSLVDRVSAYCHAYTLYSSVRPFGTTIMFGTYSDLNGPELYCVENSGLHYAYWGCAVSKNDCIFTVCKNEIETFSLTEFFSSNQLFSDFFSKTIAFTNLFREKREREFLQFPLYSLIFYCNMINYHF